MDLRVQAQQFNDSIGKVDHDFHGACNVDSNITANTTAESPSSRLLDSFSISTKELVPIDLDFSIFVVVQPSFCETHEELIFLSKNVTDIWYFGWDSIWD